MQKLHVLYFLLISGVKAQLNLNYNIDPIEILKTQINEKICERLINDPSGSSTNCTKQLHFMCEGIKKKELWALKMFDASAKPQSGILYGNIMHVGNYDECLNIDYNVYDEQILGKYCTAMYNFNNNSLDDRDADALDTELLMQLKMSYGLCVPSICETAELQGIINMLNLSFNLIVDDRFCDSLQKQHLPFTTKEIIGIAIFSFFGVLITLSTLYDYFIYQKSLTPDTRNLVYTSFSFYSNSKKLLSSKTGEDSLLCLNGIRVISMMWIILCHRYLLLLYFPLINLTEMLDEWLYKMESMFVLGATVSVDTFFTISGLLIMYIYLKNVDKGIKLSAPGMYLHRILRLTPSLLMIVIFSATLFDVVGSGPFWPAHTFFVESCEKYWWSTLLYVQNYVNPGEVCVGQSWYLAVDTQLYFLSPVFLYFIIPRPRTTISVMLLLSAISMSASFGITWKNSYLPSFLVLNRDLQTELYTPTHLRITPWLFGMICGYVIHKSRNTKIRINKFLVVILWVLLITMLVSIILYHIRFINGFEKNFSTTTPMVLESSLYNGFIRPIWSLTLCFVVFLCVSGHGGIINDFLSCTIFNILIRFNYSMYLLHMFMIMFFMGQKRTVDYVSNISNFHAFWGDFMYTLMLSVIWTLAFESPIIALEKSFFGKKSKKIENDVNRNTILRC